MNNEPTFSERFTFPTRHLAEQAEGAVAMFPGCRVVHSPARYGGGTVAFTVKGPGESIPEDLRQTLRNFGS